MRRARGSARPVSTIHRAAVDEVSGGERASERPDSGDEGVMSAALATIDYTRRCRNGVIEARFVAFFG